MEHRESNVELVNIDVLERELSVPDIMPIEGETEAQLADRERVIVAHVS